MDLIISLFVSAFFPSDKLSDFEFFFIRLLFEFFTQNSERSLVAISHLSPSLAKKVSRVLIEHTFREQGGSLLNNNYWKKKYLINEHMIGASSPFITFSKTEQLLFIPQVFITPCIFNRLELSIILWASCLVSLWVLLPCDFRQTLPLLPQFYCLFSHSVVPCHHLSIIHFLHGSLLYK